MNYFIIVFGAFNVILCGYMWWLIDTKDALVSENAQIKVMLETQKVQHTAEKIEYLEKLEQSKNQTIDKFLLDKSSCQNELESYKKLIRAM